MASISVADFNPNTLPMWLVYDGRLKVYERRASAISRFIRPHRYGGHAASKLFEWDTSNSVWTLLAHLKPRPADSPCDICGCSTLAGNAWGSNTDEGRFVFDRRGRKLLEPLRLLYTCLPCRHGRGLY